MSGAGKTSLLATFAEYLWETHKKILLLYSWDGGAIPNDLQARMHQGLVRFWRARTRSGQGLALETLMFATKGYWPRQIDPRTGETTPAVDLVAPITTIYEMYRDDGKTLIKRVPAASLIKPVMIDGQMVQVEQMVVKEMVSRTKGFELVGGVAFDGLSSMSTVVMDSQDQMRGQGLIGGEKSSFGGTVVSGSVKYGGNNRADVGFAQTRANQYVNNSLSIPYLVESPVFTGLSTEGTDKGGNTIIGVDLPGQAALTQAPQWFGNICEASKIRTPEGDECFALNLRPFTDSQGRYHLLKTSASPWGVPQTLVDPPQGKGVPFSEFNLGKVFRLLDQDLQLALAKDLRSGLPGMSDGLAEVGEPVRVEETPVTSTPVRPTVPSAPATAGAVQPGPGRPAAAPRRAAAPPAAPAAKPAGATAAPTAGASAPSGTPMPPGRPPMRAPGS